MDAQRKCLLLLAKMVLQDGTISAEERQTLEDMGNFTHKRDIERLIEEAKKVPFADLITGIDKYEDRVLIALKARVIAHSDKHFELSEEIHLDYLIKCFGITNEDRQLIERVEGRMRGVVPQGPEPRLMELHKGSSFFKGSN